MLDVYDLSYNEVLSLLSTRKDIFNKFNKILGEVSDKVFSYNKKLGQMIIETQELIENEKSTYAFPGEYVKYYSNLKYGKVVKPFLCPVSSEIVSKGKEEVLWAPVFWLPNKNEFYCLSKKIRALSYYDDFFPTDISSFDEFYFKVNNAYELGFEDYYDFATNIGGSLNLRKLKK